MFNLYKFLWKYVFVNDVYWSVRRLKPRKWNKQSMYGFTSTTVNKTEYGKKIKPPITWTKRTW